VDNRLGQATGPLWISANANRRNGVAPSRRFLRRDENCLPSVCEGEAPMQTSSE